MNFENILEILLTFIKQTSLIHNIYRVSDWNWYSRCLKLDGRQQSSKNEVAIRDTERKEQTSTKEVRKKVENGIRKRNNR